MSKDIQKKIKELRQLIHRHNHLYHVQDQPEISDSAYDSLYRQLIDLEQSYPQYQDPLSPSVRVGGKLIESFSKISHQFPQWSFDNVFSFHELEKWEQKIHNLLNKEHRELIPFLDYLVELKIDGLKLILDYKDGKFIRGATRGDGSVGEDITENLKTVKTIPLLVPEKRAFSVVAEAWISKTDFLSLNKDRATKDLALYANPRNLAAGTLRQLDSAIVASRNIQTFAYDFDSQTISFQEHKQELDFLEQQGFQVNQDYLLTKKISEIQSWYESWINKRQLQSFGIDGMVIKINQTKISSVLGYTAKAPRFAVAYKFPAEQQTTLVNDIIMQIGRTGVLTPVAILEAVDIDGSRVSRATLHNESEIQRLDVRIGDTVIVEKSGDIIPKIKKVVHELRPKEAKSFDIPRYLDQEGIEAHQERSQSGVIVWRTQNGDEMIIQNFVHFCSKKAMNIEGMGEQHLRSLYEAGFISQYHHIYELTREQIMSLPLFKEKATENLLQGIEASRRVNFSSFIFALGIRFVGEEMARIYADNFDSTYELSHADYQDLISIYGIGHKTAESTVQWFSDPQKQVEFQALVGKLDINYPLDSSEKKIFKNKTFVITGSFQEYSREDITEIILKRGGKVSSSISAKTNYLIVGDKAGSKLSKAKELATTILSLSSFKKLIEDEEIL